MKMFNDRQVTVKGSRSNGGDIRKVWPMDNRGNIPDAKNHPRFNQVNTLKPKKIVGGEIPRQIVIDGLDDPESFHCAIGRILIVAQCFGVLPVYGVLEPSPRALAFRKLSLRTAYALLLTTMLTIVTIGALVHMFKSLNSSAFEMTGGIRTATAGAVFYGNSLAGLLLFFRLSSRWPSLQNEWQAVERLIDSSRWGRPKLRWKFLIISIIVLLCALLEHIVSVVNSTVNWRESKNATATDFLEEYSRNSHDFIINLWGYSPAWGLYLFVVSKAATFVWNFTDLFIMLVSVGLAQRYKMLNRRLISMKNSITVGDWKTMRECYAALSTLVKRVDCDISPIVLLSFANNLYFICLQLLNGISVNQTDEEKSTCVESTDTFLPLTVFLCFHAKSEPENNEVVYVIYFFASFGFLIGRTIGVTLLAARINDQSRVALPVLYTCSSSTYTIETQRLESQLSTDTIALSGLSFFSITRNFMLAVAGAILTYEVVLLQFNLALNQK